MSALPPGHVRRSLPAVVLVSCLLAGCGATSGDPVTPPDRFELVWSDEFDGAAGTRPDAKKWTFDVGGSGWGNRQLEYDTDSPDNASLDGDGHLAIVARKQAFDRNQYTSARLKTQGLFTQKYGRMEARLKLPPGRGIWPAFWALGSNFADAGWPACGEIDVMEFKGQEPNVVHGSLHGPGYSGASPITSRFRSSAAERFDADFHVFAVEWDPGRIAFFVDDEAYSIVTAAEVLARGDWAFDQPFFLLLNVAVGGDFVGAPDATTPFPATMQVDWVRVYRRVP